MNFTLTSANPFGHPSMACCSTAKGWSFTALTRGTCGVISTRYDPDESRWRRRRALFRGIRTGHGSTIVSASASPPFTDPMTRESSRLKVYQEVDLDTRYGPAISYYTIVFTLAMKTARDLFTEEISFQTKDKDISLAKALLYVAAEDEAFIATNQEIDAWSLLSERRNTVVPFAPQDWDCMEKMPLTGKTVSGWLKELDIIAREVEAELVSRDIGCHLVEVLDAVNVVLFESRGFQRSSVATYSKHSYLHSVLSTGIGSAVLLSIIYIEVCQRISLSMVGSRVGEELLIWPQTGNPAELFKVTSGQSLFAIVNGRCVEDPRSRASDLTSSSLIGLDIASKRDIIGIALANLIRLHWKRASRSNYGLMLTSPLRHVHGTSEKFNKKHSASAPLLRSQDLRLAIMASERLLALQPHNWVLRRNHGMMLYYSRDYGKAVQELSICMAFAPEDDADVLEPFVEKLHLLRLESTWTSFGHAGRLAVS